MSDEKPQKGLVIRHVYLWRDEARKGYDEGRKARPCLIIRTQENARGETEVYIAPITHTDPKNKANSIGIPLQTKQRLGLDHEKSWIITDDINRFTWKGPDVRRTPSGKFAYGHLPPGLTNKAVQQVYTLARERRITITERDDEYLKKRLESLSESVKKKTQNKERER